VLVNKELIFLYFNAFFGFVSSLGPKTFTTILLFSEKL
jgi:hypothetical protein